MRKDLINVLVNVLPIEDYDEITSYIARLEKENERLQQYIVFYKDLTEQQNNTINNYKLRCDKTTNYYYKTLAEYEKENKLMPDESVMMFNLLEGNR
jgi:hypothetical protein